MLAGGVELLDALDVGEYSFVAACITIAITVFLSTKLDRHLSIFGYPPRNPAHQKTISVAHDPRHVPR